MNEHATLSAALDRRRAAIRAACHDLTDDRARQTPLATSPKMSVAALVAHLACVERNWFEGSFLGHRDRAIPDPFDQPPPTDSLATLLDGYDTQCARSREITATNHFDTLEAWSPPGLDLVNLRWIVLHLTEETARHLGQLQVLRQLIS